MRDERGDRRKGTGDRREERGEGREVKHGHLHGHFLPYPLQPPFAIPTEVLIRKPQTFQIGCIPEII